jgi:hypothetical protein
MKSSDTQMELVRRYLGGEATVEEARRLESMLAVDAQLRRDYLAYARVEAGLSSKVRPKLVKTAPPNRWLTWRPLAAAAAGIVFGMFCTSVVFAYVAPSLGKVLTLLQDSFESGPAPEVTGLPKEIGEWSGDFTEVVGEQLGVKPPNGKKMLRFLRADYEGKSRPEGSYICDVYHLVDMRTYREHFADGSAVVQFSAEFYAPVMSAEGSYGADQVQVYACDEKTARAVLREGRGINEKNVMAMAKNGRRLGDSTDGTWQRISVEMRVPPKTEFLFLHIAASRPSVSNVPASFEGRYVDGVRLSLGRRAPIP